MKTRKKSMKFDLTFPRVFAFGVIYARKAENAYIKFIFLTKRVEIYVENHYT